MPIKRAGLVRRSVLEGSEERFRVWIVVRDMRAAEGRHRSEPMQGRDQDTGKTRLNAIGVQYETARIDVTEWSKYGGD